MRRILLTALMFALPLLWAQPSGAVVLDRVVAVVNSEIITWLELHDAMRNEFAPKLRDMDEAAQKEALATAEKDYLDAMVLKKLQLQEAARLNLTARDPEVDSTIENIRQKYGLSPEAFRQAIEDTGTSWDNYRRSLMEQITLSRLVDRQVRSKLTDLSREDKPAEEASYHLKQIFIGMRQDPAELEARVKDVYEAFGSAPDFESVAKVMSEGPNADTGGDLGVVEASLLSGELKEVVGSLSEGQISPPVRTAKGVHIIKMQRIVSAGDKEAEKRFDRFYSEWLGELKLRANIDIRL